MSTRQDGSRRTSQDSWSDIPAVCGAVVFLWLGAATFVRFDNGATSDYLLIPNPLWHAVAWLVLVVVVRAAMRRLLGDAVNRPPVWGDGRGMVAWAWLSVLSLLMLFAAFPRVPALLYVSHDLRWWWGALIGIGILASWPHIATVVSRALQGRGAIAALVIGVTAFSISSSGWQTALVVHGDEPKYLRIAENLYQGRGFDIAGKQNLTAAAAPSRVLWNVAALPEALRTEARLLAGDVRRWLDRGADAQLRSGPPTEGLFFEGKHPGSLYQVHTPGLSVVLLPAYYIDRQWTGSGIGYQEEFPEYMPAVKTMLLGLLVSLAVAMHGLLRSVGTSPVLAVGIAGVGTVALPAGAFADQIYPETCAAVIVALLVRWLVSCQSGGLRAALGHGLMAGVLPWLHLRFSLVAVVAVVWVVLCHRRPLRGCLAFIGVSATGFVTLALYTYRLTGSLIPTALHGESVPLSLERVSHGVPAFFMDRTFGVLAHSPLFVLAFAGLVCLWMSRSRLATLLTLLLLAVVVPAAGHGYWAAGATPGRYLVVAVPLLAVAVGAACTRLATRRWTTGLLGVLTLVTLETAWQYNWFYRKDLGSLIAPGLSGWRLNLAFPDLGDGWYIGGADRVLLVCWVGALVALAIVVARSPMFRAAGPITPEPQLVHQTMVGLLLMAVVATVLTSLSGLHTAKAFSVSNGDARMKVLARAANQVPSAYGVASGAGLVDPVAEVGNDLDIMFIRIASDITAGALFDISIRPRTTRGDYALSDLLVDFGDGHAMTASQHVGDLDVQHTFQQAGIYRVRAVAVYGATRAEGHVDVTVR